MSSTPGSANIMANIPNTAVIQDDIVRATADNETYYQTLELVITALEKAGLTVSLSKFIGILV